MTDEELRRLAEEWFTRNLLAYFGSGRTSVVLQEAVNDFARRVAEEARRETLHTLGQRAALKARGGREMGDMADWATDNGLMPEDEWVQSAKDTEIEKLRAKLVRAHNAKRKAEESELRTAAELDEARAERDRLREALKEVHEWVEGRDEAGCLAAVEIIERALASGEESR